MSIPQDAKSRKAIPVFSGVINYFPDAIVEVARVSKIGNDQHNPGQPLHWAKEKSTDEPDALLRHLIDHAQGVIYDPDGGRVLAKVAWRALALLQRAMDAEAEEREALEYYDEPLPEPYKVGDTHAAYEDLAGGPLDSPIDDWLLIHGGLVT